MTKKGEMERLMNIKKVIFAMRLSFRAVFDYGASNYEVDRSKKLMIRKLMMRITTEQMNSLRV
jgi:hypothetical protein